MSTTYSAGLMTAYGAAKDDGYTGTYAQFCQAMRDLAGIVASATTLPAGSQATAEYNNGTLSLGIPKGDKGDRGETGATGPTGATGQTGATGNGIASVTKTGTSGLVDTYTITFTDGTTTTFEVTNGEDGEVTQAQLDEVIDDVTDLKTATNQINEGYYPQTLIPNKYILRDNGQEANYNGWSATDFIELRAGYTLVCHTPATLAWGARYDANKTYIEAYGWTDGASYFNDTGATTYFRTSGATGTMTSVLFELLPLVDTTLSKYGYPAESRTVGERLAAIEAKEGAVPSYYKTQLATKEAIIRGHFDECAFNGDGLIFLTDTHFSTDLFTSDSPTSYFNANNSFSLISDIFKNCSIGRVVFGGDVVNSASDIDTMLLCMSAFRNRFENRQGRLMYCVGNHEYFTGADFGQTTKPTPSDLYGAGIKYAENVIGEKGPNNTYYFDNTLQKVRYFVVSCGRDTETTTEQINWLTNQFGNIPTGYKVVCIGHGFIADSMTAFRGSYQPIVNALDTAKTSNNVDVVCIITGHTHIDGSLTTASGIPCICTTTDSYALNYELVNDTPTAAPRTKGTTDEQAFDVFQFDFTNRKIYVTRIGYGSDRTFTY